MIHPTAKVSEQSIGSAPSQGTGLYNFQPPTPIPSPKTPHLLNHRHWCHLANELKPYCKQLPKLQIYTSGIATISMQQGYSRQ